MSAGEFRNRIFWLKTRSGIFAVLVIIWIVLPPVVNSVDTIRTPTAQYQELDPIEGDAGFSTVKTMIDSTREVTIYNGTVLDSAAEWELYEFEMATDEITPDSVTFSLISSRDRDFETRYSFAAFRGFPSFPIMNYSKVTYSIEIEVHRGAVNASITSGLYKFLASGGTYPPWHNGTTIAAGQKTQVTLNPSIESIRNLTASWITRTWINVAITALEASVVTLGRVEITAISTEDLYPVTFDIQASDGMSLFLNPFINYIGAYYRDWSPYPSQPVFTLIRNNGTEAASYGPRVCNETLFLGIGNYTGTVGWMREPDHLPESNKCIEISFQINSNERVFVFARIPSSRVYFEINPSFVYCRVAINFYSSMEYYSINYVTTYPNYVYIPPEEFFRVYLTPVSYNYQSLSDEYHLSNRIHGISVNIQKEEFSCVFVSADFPQFEIGCFVFSAGQFAFAFPLLALIALSIIAPIFDLRSRENRHRLLLFVPSYLTILSLVVPWVQYTFQTDSYPPVSISGFVFPPILSTMWGAEGSLLTPVAHSYLLPIAWNIAIFVFYMIPMLYLMHSMFAKQEHLQLKHMTDEYPHIGWAVFLLPFIFAMSYWIQCWLGLCVPSFGLVIAVLTLPAYIILFAYEERQ